MMSTATSSLKTSRQQLVLLDKARKRPANFGRMHPEVATSIAQVRSSLAHATKDTLWVSYERELTESLLHSMWGPPRSLGRALLIHALDPLSLPMLASCFKRFAIATPKSILPPDELAEALDAQNSPELFIAGNVDQANQRITLWRGNLEPLAVPFSAFEKSGDGIEPDFSRFSLTDCGQTIQLGDYEAAADAILYEFDPEYRRQVVKQRQQSERTFGAALRRLRKQRGLRREDFAPHVAAKTIARIEQGLVQKVHQTTLQAIAQRLQVQPEEIASY